jgi:hypothetical protein
MEKEKSVVEKVVEVLPSTWEVPQSYWGSKGDYGNLSKGTKLLVEFKNEVIKGNEENAKEKLKEFLQMLENGALPLWEEKKEEFKQLLENFENYFEKLKEALEPGYEQYLTQKQRDEETARMFKGFIEEGKRKNEEKKEEKESIAKRVKGLFRR